jgi:GT2 family glycosyltransferase
VRLDRRTSCGTARNIVVEHARGGLVLFVDADCVVPPDWLERMVAARRDLEADAVCGAFANGTPWSLTGTTGFFLEFFRFLGPRGRRRQVRHLLGGNSIFRRSLLLGERFADGNAGDDFDLAGGCRVRAHGSSFAPAIGVTHLNRWASGTWFGTRSCWASGRCGTARTRRRGCWAPSGGYRPWSR